MSSYGYLLTAVPYTALSYIWEEFWPLQRFQIIFPQHLAGVAEIEELITRLAQILHNEGVELEEIAKMCKERDSSRLLKKIWVFKDAFYYLIAVCFISGVPERSSTT
jgi:hypothetical protein